MSFITKAIYDVKSSVFKIKNDENTSQQYESIVSNRVNRPHQIRNRKRPLAQSNLNSSESHLALNTISEVRQHMSILLYWKTKKTEPNIPHHVELLALRSSHAKSSSKEDTKLKKQQKEKIKKQAEISISHSDVFSFSSPTSVITESNVSQDSGIFSIDDIIQNLQTESKPRSMNISSRILGNHLPPLKETIVLQKEDRVRSLCDQLQKLDSRLGKDLIYTLSLVSSYTSKKDNKVSLDKSKFVSEEELYAFGAPLNFFDPVSNQNDWFMHFQRGKKSQVEKDTYTNNPVSEIREYDHDARLFGSLFRPQGERDAAYQELDFHISLPKLTITSGSIARNKLEYPLESHKIRKQRIKEDQQASFYDNTSSQKLTLTPDDTKERNKLKVLGWDSIPYQQENFIFDKKQHDWPHTTPLPYNLFTYQYAQDNLHDRNSKILSDCLSAMYACPSSLFTIQYDPPMVKLNSLRLENINYYDVEISSDYSYLRSVCSNFADAGTHYIKLQTIIDQSFVKSKDHKRSEILRKDIVFKALSDSIVQWLDVYRTSILSFQKKINATEDNLTLLGLQFETKYLREEIQILSFIINNSVVMFSNGLHCPMVGILEYLYHLFSTAQIETNIKVNEKMDESNELILTLPSMADHKKGYSINREQNVLFIFKDLFAKSLRPLFHKLSMATFLENNFIKLLEINVEQNVRITSSKKLLAHEWNTGIEQSSIDDILRTKINRYNLPSFLHDLGGLVHRSQMLQNLICISDIDLYQEISMQRFQIKYADDKLEVEKILRHFKSIQMGLQSILREIIKESRWKLENEESKRKRKDNSEKEKKAKTPQWRDISTEKNTIQEVEFTSYNDDPTHETKETNKVLHLQQVSDEKDFGKRNKIINSQAISTNDFMLEAAKKVLLSQFDVMTKLQDKKMISVEWRQKRLDRLTEAKNEMRLLQEIEQKEALSKVLQQEADVSKVHNSEIGYAKNNHSPQRIRENVKRNDNGTRISDERKEAGQNIANKIDRLEKEKIPVHSMMEGEIISTAIDSPVSTNNIDPPGSNKAKNDVTQSTYKLSAETIDSNIDERKEDGDKRLSDAIECSNFETTNKDSKQIDELIATSMMPEMMPHFSDSTHSHCIAKEPGRSTCKDIYRNQSNEEDECKHLKKCNRQGDNKFDLFCTIDEALDICVFKPMKVYYDLLGEITVAYFIHRTPLFCHLSLLRKVMLGLGTYLQSFSLLLEEVYYSCNVLTNFPIKEAIFMSRINNAHLKGILICDINENDLNMLENLSYRVHMNSVGGESCGFSFLSVEYDVPSPLSQIIDNASMEKYKKIQAFLLRHIRTEQELIDLWKMLNNGALKMNKQQRWLHIFRHKVQYVISVFSQYFNVHLLCSSKKVHQQLSSKPSDESSELRCLEDLYFVHQNDLNYLSQVFFLNQEYGSAQIASCLNNVYKCVFFLWSEMCIESRDSVQSMKDEKSRYRLIISEEEKFEENMNDFEEILRKLSDHGLDILSSCCGDLHISLFS